MQEIDRFRDKLDPDTLRVVDALRGLIAKSDARLIEGFKWNGPSFMVGEAHRITIGLERNGSVRLVLHRDTKPADPVDLRHCDPDAIAKWPAPDRATLSFRTVSEVHEKSDALADLISAWLRCTC